ncbi:MAG: class I SAM-dependent methyltransferase [Rhizobiales bacterium]|nr:class I SAM-dependent methyltransferase [Hyphomicrobiales bacterium]
MSNASIDIGSRNAAMFNLPSVADWYLGETTTGAEQRLLVASREDFSGRRVLDLGVGTGRTTGYILPYAADYLGIDLAPEMLARARRAFPAANLVEMDMRDLGRLPEASRDYALGSYGALDVFDEPERQAVILSIRRLLAPGGVFVFSAHNRDSRHAGGRPSLPLSANPVRLLRDARQFAIGSVNFRRMAPFEKREADYAMLRDVAHQWRGVFYYVSPAAQTRQLAGLGFAAVTVIGEDGRDVAPGEPTREDGLLHYRCVRV